MTSINNNVHTEVHLYVSQEHKIGPFFGTDLITKAKEHQSYKFYVALQVWSGGQISRDGPANRRMARRSQWVTLLWFQQKGSLQAHEATVLTSRMTLDFLDYCDYTRCIN